MDIRKLRATRPKSKQPSLTRPGGCNPFDFSISIVVEDTSGESSQKSSIDSLKKEITSLKIRLERRNIKLSKIAEA